MSVPSRPCAPDAGYERRAMAACFGRASRALVRNLGVCIWRCIGTTLHWAVRARAAHQHDDAAARGAVGARHRVVGEHRQRLARAHARAPRAQRARRLAAELDGALGLLGGDLADAQHVVDGQVEPRRRRVLLHELEVLEQPRLAWMMRRGPSTTTSVSFGGAWLQDQASRRDLKRRAASHGYGGQPGASRRPFSTELPCARRRGSRAPRRAARRRARG